jgi:peptidoglycan/xylan/chitin deacetylase (PgdA/CDA1 family)
VQTDHLSRRIALQGLAALVGGGALVACSNALPRKLHQPPADNSLQSAEPSPDRPGYTIEPSATPIPQPLPDPNAGVMFARSGDPLSGMVAITIDDFAYPYVVKESMLGILDSYPDVRMTMFPVGDRIVEVEQVVPGFWKLLVDRGHEIGFHTMHHDDLGDASTDQLRREIEEFNQILAEVLGLPGFAVRYGRATYGNYGKRVQFEQTAQQMGITWVLWSSIPSNVSAPSLEFDDAITAGEVALFHVRYQDMYRLSPYIDACLERGLSLATLREMPLVAEQS